MPDSWRPAQLVPLPATPQQVRPPVGRAILPLPMLNFDFDPATDPSILAAQARANDLAEVEATTARSVAARDFVDLRYLPDGASSAWSHDIAEAVRSLFIQLYNNAVRDRQPPAEAQRKAREAAHALCRVMIGVSQNTHNQVIRLSPRPNNVVLLAIAEKARRAATNIFAQLYQCSLLGEASHEVAVLTAYRLSETIAKSIASFPASIYSSLVNHHGGAVALSAAQSLADLLTDVLSDTAPNLLLLVKDYEREWAHEVSQGIVSAINKSATNTYLAILNARANNPNTTVLARTAAKTSAEAVESVCLDTFENMHRLYDDYRSALVVAQTLEMSTTDFVVETFRDIAMDSPADHAVEIAIGIIRSSSINISEAIQTLSRTPLGFSQSICESITTIVGHSSRKTYLDTYYKVQSVHGHEMATSLARTSCTRAGDLATSATTSYLLLDRGISSDEEGEQLTGRQTNSLEFYGLISSAAAKVFQSAYMAAANAHHLDAIQSAEELFNIYEIAVKCSVALTGNNGLPLDNVTAALIIPAVIKAISQSTENCIAKIHRVSADQEATKATVSETAHLINNNIIALYLAEESLVGQDRALDNALRSLISSAEAITNIFLVQYRTISGLLNPHLTTHNFAEICTRILYSKFSPGAALEANRPSSVMALDFACNTFEDIYSAILARHNKRLADSITAQNAALAATAAATEVFPAVYTYLRQHNGGDCLTAARQITRVVADTSVNLYITIFERETSVTRPNYAPAKEAAAQAGKSVGTIFLATFLSATGHGMSCEAAVAHSRQIAATGASVIGEVFFRSYSTANEDDNINRTWQCAHMVAELATTHFLSAMEVARSSNLSDYNALALAQATAETVAEVTQATFLSHTTYNKGNLSPVAIDIIRGLCEDAASLGVAIFYKSRRLLAGQLEEREALIAARAISSLVYSYPEDNPLEEILPSAVLSGLSTPEDVAIEAAISALLEFRARLARQSPTPPDFSTICSLAREAGAIAGWTYPYLIPSPATYVGQPQLICLASLAKEAALEGSRIFLNDYLELFARTNGDHGLALAASINSAKAYSAVIETTMREPACACDFGERTRLVQRAGRNAATFAKEMFLELCPSSSNGNKTAINAALQAVSIGAKAFTGILCAGLPSEDGDGRPSDILKIARNCALVTHEAYIYAYNKYLPSTSRPLSDRPEVRIVNTATELAQEALEQKRRLSCASVAAECAGETFFGVYQRVSPVDCAEGTCLLIANVAAHNLPSVILRVYQSTADTIYTDSAAHIARRVQLVLARNFVNVYNTIAPQRPHCDALVAAASAIDCISDGIMTAYLDQEFKNEIYHALSVIEGIGDLIGNSFLRMYQQWQTYCDPQIAIEVAGEVTNTIAIIFADVYLQNTISDQKQRLSESLLETQHAADNELEKYTPPSPEPTPAEQSQLLQQLLTAHRISSGVNLEELIKPVSARLPSPRPALPPGEVMNEEVWEQYGRRLANVIRHVTDEESLERSCLLTRLVDEATGHDGDVVQYSDYSWLQRILIVRDAESPAGWQVIRQRVAKIIISLETLLQNQLVSSAKYILDLMVRYSRTSSDSVIHRLADVERELELAVCPQICQSPTDKFIALTHLFVDRYKIYTLEQRAALVAREDENIEAALYLTARYKEILGLDTAAQNTIRTYQFKNVFGSYQEELELLINLLGDRERILDYFFHNSETLVWRELLLTTVMFDSADRAKTEEYYASVRQSIRATLSSANTQMGISHAADGAATPATPEDIEREINHRANEEVIRRQGQALALLTPRILAGHGYLRPTS